MNCPVCGTENRAGSKFCSNCGAGLSPDSDQICPNCQAPNPDDRLYCAECGARLAESELPEESSAAASGIPDWLADIEAESPPVTDGIDVEAREQGMVTGREPADAVPDWLADLEAGEGKADEVHSAREATELPEEAVPAWLADLEAETPAEEESSEPEGAPPSWLAHVDALPEELESDLEEEADRWLTDLDPVVEEEFGSTATESADEFPGWLSEWAEESEGEAPWDEESGEPAADWLGDLESAGRAMPGEGDERPATSDSLLESGRGADPSPEKSRKSSLDWLADRGAEPEAEFTLEEGPGEFAEETDRADSGDWDAEAVPDWLADLAAGTSETEETPAPEDTDELEPPGRLTDREVEGPGDPDFVFDTPAEAAEAPDWLADLQAGDLEEAPGDEEMLEWLQEDDEKALPAAAEEVDEAFESLAEAAEAPDWLADLQPGEPEDAPGDEEMLEWLQEDDEAALPAEVEGSEEVADWMAAEVEPSPATMSPVEETDQVPDESSEETDSDQIPAWLAGTEAAPGPPMLGEAEETDPADASQADALLPDNGDDWLQALGDAGEDEVEEVAPGATPPSEMPEWLRQMAPPDTGPLTPRQDAEAIPEDLDDFLGDLGDAEEMPEWLGDVATEQGRARDSSAFATGPDEEQVDDQEPFPEFWSDSGPADEEPARAEHEEARPEESLPAESDLIAGAGATETYIPEDDLPDWLGDVMGDLGEPEAFMFGEETEAPVPSSAAEDDGLAEEPAGDEYPEWLESDEAEPVPTELPDWLVESAVMEEDSSPEGAQLDDLLDELLSEEEPDQALSEAEIPEWVQSLKPRELSRMTTEETPEEGVSDHVVAVGPLAGLRGVIAVEPTIAEPRTAERVAGVSIGKEQERQAALLRQMARSSPQAAIPVGVEKISASSPLLRILLSLLLLAATLTGLLFPDLLDIVPPSADLDVVSTMVDEAALQPVLVAFDYTPAMMGALDAQASLLLAELAQSGSPVLFTSQSAAGLALAEQKAASVPDLNSRRVGYLPGSTIGLRRLAPCLQAGASCQTIFGAPLSEEVSSGLSESALLVVLAGDRESAISWIEQVAVTTDKPMLTIVPQAVEPVIAPYYSSGQIAGLWSAPAAAIAAEQGDDTNGAEGNRVAATALAQWLAIGLLLVGNLFYLARGFLPAGRGPARTTRSNR